MVAAPERSLQHRYFIRAPPSRVFQAISDAEWLTKWLCDHASLAPRKGGRYELGWTGGPTHTGKVLDFQPSHRIAFEWRWPGVRLKATVFSLSVEPKDEGCLLLVEHTGFPRTEEWADLYGGAEWGWTYFAMNLKSVLENGHDLRSRHDG